jgi:hypothetical protein
MAEIAQDGMRSLKERAATDRPWSRIKRPRRVSAARRGHEARGGQACGGMLATPYESDADNSRLCCCVEGEAVWPSDPPSGD